nr:MAG TPA: hypothetical protein [Caudoviricetes sp.]
MIRLRLARPAAAIFRPQRICATGAYPNGFTQ